MSKQFWLLQTIQAGLGFDEEAERLLTAVSPHIQSDKLTTPLPATARAMHPLFNRWARHNLLAPRDAIYAQRLWILGLVGIHIGVPLTTLTDAVRSIYRQIADLMEKETLARCQGAMEKGMQADISMLEQCYGRASRPNVT